MTQRIGIVTGGGDCPGLNAVIRAVSKAAAKRGWEAIGFFGGYEGMLDPPKYRSLNYQDVGGLLTRGGTILGHGQPRPLLGEGGPRGKPDTAS